MLNSYLPQVSRGSLRVFVFTIGFHEDHAIRLLTTSGAGPDDIVVVLTASPIIAGTRRAIEGLRAFTLRIGVNNINVIEVPPTIDGIIKVVKVFCNAKVEYILGLSGGMRYLVVYTLLALMLTGRTARIHIYPEGGEGPEIVLDRYVLNSIINPPTESEIRILNIVYDNPGIVDEDIAEVIGRKPKTVKNIVAELSKKGLVARRGRKGGIYPTEWGRVIAEVSRLTTSSDRSNFNKS